MASAQRGTIGIAWLRHVSTKDRGFMCSDGMNRQDAACLVNTTLTIFSQVHTMLQPISGSPYNVLRSRPEA